MSGPLSSMVLSEKSYEIRQGSSMTSSSKCTGEEGNGVENEDEAEKGAPKRDTVEFTQILGFEMHKPVTSLNEAYATMVEYVGLTVTGDVAIASSRAESQTSLVVSKR